MAGLVVRAARVADRPVLVDLWREVDDLHSRILPRFFRRGAEARRPEEIERILAARDEALLVAESDRVVGLVHVLLYDTPPVAQLTPGRRAHVDTLVVASQVRRRGIGRRLMDEAASWARARGAVEI